MQRKKIRWKKLGGGSFRFKDGRVIRRDEIFMASIDDIPEAFRDVVVPLDPIPDDFLQDELSLDQEEAPLHSLYEIKSAEEGNFNVVRFLGEAEKTMNTYGLLEDEAKELKVSLENNNDVNWKIPSVWKDGECWIMGGGFSMPSQFEVPDELIRKVISQQCSPSEYSPYLSSLHSKHVIAVNTAVLIGDWFDVLFFGDRQWYMWHREPVRLWPGLQVTCESWFANKDRQKQERVKYVSKDKKKRQGLGDNLDALIWNVLGANSGATAIDLAAHFGAKRIILLGFDMKLSEDGEASHWHNLNRDEKTLHSYGESFQIYSQCFSAIAEDAKKRGIEILNANPDSALEDFPKVHVKELL